MATETDELAVLRVDILDRLEMISRTLIRIEAESLKIKSSIGRIENRVATLVETQAKRDGSP